MRVAETPMPVRCGFITQPLPPEAGAMSSNSKKDPKATRPNLKNVMEAVRSTLRERGELPNPLSKDEPKKDAAKKPKEA